MANRFVITKNTENRYIFTIKQTCSTLPMEVCTGTLYKQTQFAIPYNEIPEVWERPVSTTITQDVILIMTDISINVSTLTICGTSINTGTYTTLNTLVNAINSNPTITNKCTAILELSDRVRLINKQAWITNSEQTALTVTNITGSGLTAFSTVIGYTGQSFIANNVMVPEKYIITANGVSSLFIGTIYRQSTEPTAEVSRARDVWINTSSNGATKIYDGAIWATHIVDIWVDTINYSLTWKYDDHNEPYQLLTALKAILPTTVTTVIDANILTVSKNSEFILNSDNVLSVQEVSKYKAAVTGQKLVLAVAGRAAIQGSSAVPYVMRHYLSNNDTEIIINTAELYTTPADHIATVKIILPIDVKVGTDIVSAGTEIPVSNNTISIKTNYTETQKWYTIPSPISVEVLITLTKNGNAYTDTFKAQLKSLSTGLTIFDTPKDLTILNAKAGQILLVLTATDVNDLIIGTIGSQADRYYVIPTYKLYIECTTINNGNFLIKVPLIYVG